MLLVIDNYDSFVFNLARYFERLGQETLVVRNDAITLEEIIQLKPDAIVLSPGPCTPNEAGISLELVKSLYQQFPMLGICLGHQTIAAAFGAKIIRAKQPMHGMASFVNHNSTTMFENIPQPFCAGRYHSLIVQEASLRSCFEVTARTEDNIIMGIQHREFPLCGLQFHPESILTECGYPLLANFLKLANLQTASDLPTMNTELIARPDLPIIPPNTPVPF